MVPKTLSTEIALDSLSPHSQGHKEIYFSCFDLPSCSFHERNPQRSPGVCGISASSFGLTSVYLRMHVDTEQKIFPTLGASRTEET